jgi:hypothetical protein
VNIVIPIIPPRARQEMEMVAAVPMRKEGMERPRATTENMSVRELWDGVRDVQTGNDGGDCGSDAEQGRECICPAQSFAIDETH